MGLFTQLGYIIVRNKKEKVYSLQMRRYKGISRYECWPLWNLQDKTSAKLGKQLYKRIDGNIDGNRFFTVIRDEKFISKYIDHCKQMKIKTKIFFVEMWQSDNKINVISSVKGMKLLGYDCVGMIDDSIIFMDKGYITFKKEIRHNNISFNKYGLLKSLSDAQKYLKMQMDGVKENKLNKNGVELEANDIVIIRFYEITEL